MSEYVNFRYMPLEGKITGKQVLKQTEDAINDLGNKVYGLDIDQSKIDEAIEKSEEAVNTANSALSAVTTGRSVWFNTVAEMVATDIEAGVTAETKGYYVANDGGNALYLIRQEKSGDVVDGGSLIALNNGNRAELVTDGTVNVKQFGAIGNGTDDDTTVFQNTSSYAQANGFVPFVGVATYKITSNITGTFNSFGEVTITGGGTVDIINLQEVVSDVSDIHDEVVDETASAKAYSESAATSATNASNSASSASTTARTLTDIYNEAIASGQIVAPAIDKTLSVTGAAADANITGGEINNIKNGVSKKTGVVVPHLEIGGYSLDSGTIAFNPNYTGSIYIPQGRGIPVTANTKVSLSDYTNYKFRISVDKGDGSYEYKAYYQTTDYYTRNSGMLYVQIAKSDDSTVTSVYPMGNLLTIELPNSTLQAVTLHAGHDAVIEIKHFPVEWFGVGSFFDGYYSPNLRIYRACTKKSIVFPYDVTLSPESGYRFGLHEVIDGVWTDLGWQTGEYAIPAGTTFGVIIAKVTEDTSSTADVPTFVSKLNVVTQLRQIIDAGGYDPSATTAINAKIETYMSLFYASNNADFYTFFTDPHLMGTNGTFSKTTFKTYMDTIKGVFSKISANHVICGGDWLNSGDTKAQASAKLGYVDGKMREYFGDNYYPVVGNHDFNYLGVDSEGTRLTDANWVQPSAMHNFWFNRFEHCYYTFKRNSARKYILDTLQDYDSVGSYLQEQWDWLASELTTNDDAHSVIVMHIFYLAGQGSTIPKKTHAIGQIVQAYNAHTTCTLTSADDGYDKTYDFSGTSGHIDYILIGHSHADFTLTYGGVPVIATLNTQNGGVPSFDLVFADYDNNKVHLIRIGTGSDREINL